jgi:hypothetical protein
MYFYIQKLKVTCFSEEHVYNNQSRIISDGENLTMRSRAWLWIVIFAFLVRVLYAQNKKLLRPSNPSSIQEVSPTKLFLQVLRMKCHSQKDHH